MQYFSALKREVPFGDSKIDFMLTWSNDTRVDEVRPSKRMKISNDVSVSKMLIEVKSVTLSMPVNNQGETGADTQQYAAVFPDCVSERAQKHISCLASFVRAGLGRAAILFIIQRDDCSHFSPSALDENYARLLRDAHSQAWRCCRMCADCPPRKGSSDCLGKYLLSFEPLL